MYSKQETSLSKKFSELLKIPTDCLPENCPSGAYFISDSDGTSLYSLGFQIGGPQSTMRHGETNEWSNKRYAILVAGGNYEMSDQFKLGYYTQVVGVADGASDVRIAPGINVLNNCEKVGDANCKAPGGLDNFWRSISDITLDVSRLGAPLRFAVSQASPIRDVKIIGNDILMCDWGLGGDCGFTSGGFISKMYVSNIILGSQQQFYVANSNFGQLQAGVWNIVSHNNHGTTFGDGDISTKNLWDGYPFTQINDDIILQIPRIIFDQGNWSVQIASGKKDANSFVVLSLDNDTSPTIVSKDKVQVINAEIAGGAPGLIIMPGIYNIQGVLNIPNDKVVLGLGLPSLVCQSDSGKCMDLGSEGAHIAGMTFDAGVYGSSSNPDNILLNVGQQYHGSSINPTTLQDIYCRIARIDDAQASPSAYACVKINSDSVIGENLWLWRADHDKQSLQIPFDINYCKHGLIVIGNDVQMNGLFIEHFNDYQTIWLGKNGKIKFYQSELPYFMPSDGATVDCTVPDSTYIQKEQVCPSLYITSDASGFNAKGLGVYSFFPNDLGQKTIKAKSVLKADTDDLSISHVVMRWLNGDPESGVEYIFETNGGIPFPQGSSVDGNHNKGYAFSSYPIQSELLDDCSIYNCVYTEYDEQY
ncbi:hypothetical protein [Candidatus Bandiella euplotis]|uniref:Uncharacterized protein n=1 Tax=Candidatus Bandiella euplotis TaxID=1664265 RepID=A0ABZ0UP18_9RICK|nr:hypothetical protein [Candidatus Bandiella woodruffii]WPX97444.1 hypothetical protein Bandiella_01602 [Candidatus Bandiella woodruffii]